jgi:hypothetical protein
MRGDVTTWQHGREVGTGWSGFHKVFSGGKGIIYTISKEGVLTRHHHLGYLTGVDEWEVQRDIGTGWAGFHDVIAVDDGVLYAFTRDGRILWFRHGRRKVLIGSTAGGGATFPLFDDMLSSEGPVEIRRNFPGFRFAFPHLEDPFKFVGPH